MKEPLSVQLSHSDGVRGFMVSYLTADQSAADNESIPAVLLQALQEQVERNSPDLIPLACMNVVMPTGMITMHQNPDQSANSARTSKRGVRILKALAKFSPDAKENARAILQVANNSMENDDTQGGLVQVCLRNIYKELKEPSPFDLSYCCFFSSIQYWTDFFEKWGYQDAQRKDISKVMESILEED